MPRARTHYHHGDLGRALRCAASAVIRREGPERFSLRAIAKATGVDPAAVYRHYRDKQALLDAVAEDGFVELTEAMEAAATAHRKAAPRLRAAGEAYVRFAVTEPHLFRLMFGPGGVDPQAVAARTDSGRDAFGTLLALLDELREAGQSRLTARRAALPAWAAVHGLAELALLGRVDDLEGSLRDGLRTLLRGLSPGGADD